MVYFFIKPVILNKKNILETVLNAKWISWDKTWSIENYLSSDSWFEYEGTKKRIEYKLVSNEDDETVLLKNSKKNILIKLTPNECLFCKSQTEINYSLSYGFWELKPQII